MSSAPLPPDLAAFLRDELGSGYEDTPFTIEAPGIVGLWTGAREGEPAKGSWYFMLVTGAPAEAIRTASAGRTGGWGSVKVEVECGSSRWTTSLFSSRENGGYLLPLKAAVRKKEKLTEGDRIAVTLRLI